MKICKYCNSQVPDDAKTCENCGAVEFAYKCDNCGSEYDGMFCPRCGVKAGQIAKICPKCRTQYFSKACPECGYVGGAASSANVNEIVNTLNDAANNIENSCNKSFQNVEPKNRLWLWILGWIFIFPLPLTILLNRNKTMNQVLKWVIIVFAWLLYLGAFT